MAALSIFVKSKRNKVYLVVVSMWLHLFNVNFSHFSWFLIKIVVNTNTNVNVFGKTLKFSMICIKQPNGLLSNKNHYDSLSLFGTVLLLFRLLIIIPLIRGTWSKIFCLLFKINEIMYHSSNQFWSLLHIVRNGWFQIYGYFNLTDI